MAQEKQKGFRHILLAPMITQCLREIEKDPGRGLRKLVDLGAENAASPLWREFSETLRQKLEKDDSPHSELILEALQRVDREAQK